MANFFVPPGVDKSRYAQTKDGGFLHPWKMTVDMGETMKIGLWGGYDGTTPLKISSNNPGIISFKEPPARHPADRFIEVTGTRVGFTILDANGAFKPWCSLQIEVQKRLYTPNIPEWKFYQMAYDYYTNVRSSNKTVSEYRKKWIITEEEYTRLLSLFQASKFNSKYWDGLASSAPATFQTTDFLVMGYGGIMTKDSQYGDVVLGMRLQSIKPRSGIGSIAGAVARIFTSNPNIIGVIESSGDLIEVGLSGFAVVRENSQATKPVVYPTKTIAQKKMVGDMFRDSVAAEVARMHEGTGYIVEKEVAFQTTRGVRNGDVVLRDPSGKIVCVFECKTGLGNSIPKQVKKDRELFIYQDIKTIKVTEDFFFVR